MIRRAAVIIASLVLAAVFVAAALPKILDPGAFALAVYRYRILPGSLVNLTAIYLPWIELAAGLLLLVPNYRRSAAAILTIMLAAFTIAIASAVLRGLDLSCGCFTTSPDAARVGWINAWRNLGLLVLSIGLLACPRGAPTAADHAS